MERFPDSEYFVYDYEEQILYQYAYQSDEWVSSEVCELKSNYLNKPLINYTR